MPHAPSPNAGFTLHDSLAQDLDAITAIYAHAVRTGCASFELEPPSVEEMAARRAAILDRGNPYLVARDANGLVLGYAYAGPYRARRAYRFVVENSVYVAADRHGLGIGRRLLMALIERCTAAGYRQMIAVVGDSANAGSIALHSACGFSLVGVLQAAGWKHERWVDSVLMQRPLGEGASTPAA